jgi:cell division protein FtsA
MADSNGKTRRRGKSKGNVIAALDIGSSKICCLIARSDDENPLRVIGIGHQISQGVRAGNIVDMEAVQMAINATLDNAEDMVGEKIHKVIANFSGGRLTSRHIDVPILLNGREVADNDIERAFVQGQEEVMDDTLQLLHLVPTDFSIDGQGGIRDPRGMAGDRLTARLHMVTAHYAPIRTLSTALTRCHLQVSDVVVSPYASGLASLVDDEMELGSTVVDMGGGTTTLAVFAEGQLVHADSVPLGGMHVTNDIARVLTTPLNHAERLKTLYGNALTSASDEKEIIEVPQMGEEAPEHASHVSRAYLNSIIQPRLEETFERVKERLNAAALSSHVARRVVLTGGACQLPGVREMAQRILDRQVRIGRVTRLQGLSESASGPAYATAAGLLTYAINPNATLPRFGQDLSAGSGFFGKLAEWLRNAV